MATPEPSVYQRVELRLMAISRLFSVVPRTSALPPKADIRAGMSAFELIMSAPPPIADVYGQGAGSPLLTQPGHSPRAVKNLGRAPAHGHEVSFTPEQFRVIYHCHWCAGVPLRTPEFQVRLRHARLLCQGSDLHELAADIRSLRWLERCPDFAKRRALPNVGQPCLLEPAPQ